MQVPRMKFLKLSRYLAAMSPSPGACIIHLYLLSTDVAENPITYGSICKEMCPPPILEGDALI